MTAAASIASIAAALPPRMVGQEEAAGFFRERYGALLTARSKAILEKVFAHPGIRSRYFAFDDPDVLVSESADERMARFTRSAIALSKDAALSALRDAGLQPRDVSGIVVNTCTGYVCPGLSTYLVEELGLERTVKAYDLVGSGCGGAIPNLQLCRALAGAADGSVVLSVSVEICSCTFRMGNDLSLIVSNALFADGAAAAVVWDRPGRFTLAGSVSAYLPEYREDIRFIHKDGQLYNQLSGNLPKLIARPVADIVRTFLGKQGLGIGDIGRWAVHPGGEKVLAALQRELGLPDGRFSYSRSVLSRFGNMSSATVLFVLRDILGSGMKPGEHCLMLGFGAGFSVHAFLLRAA